MVEKYLSGEWSFADFKNTYYDFYLTDITDKELDDIPEFESNYFAEIHEKLDWVDENPDDESRQVGWIDVKQFLFWLSGRSAKLENRNS